MQTDLSSQPYNEILSAVQYLDFKEKLSKYNCSRCGLSENRSHIVVDRGNDKTSLLVIGEAPGEQEDLQGNAFVGKAGKMLDKIMASIGLDTNNDMLIVNVVKCRPPQNRAPSRDEAKACLDYLKKQIVLVNPSYIVLLGATALRHFLTGKKHFSMKLEAGKTFQIPEFPNINFMVFYHPAYLLYDPRKKTQMWEHVKNLAKHLGIEEHLIEQRF
ncbi:MAG: uracil-DNA glycosylase [Chlamydiota bacterium]|nr:uracil-DNA glycosylase [Chlamydiota bacterium]